jgi:hypothetical protein
VTVGAIGVGAHPTFDKGLAQLHTRADIKTSSRIAPQSTNDNDAVLEPDQCCQWQQASVDHRTPSAELPSLVFNFKPVIDGTEVIHEFKIRNTGNAMLRITQIQTG